MMPESFRETSDHHRLQESRGMIQRAQEIRQQTAETWAVTFDGVEQSYRIPYTGAEWYVHEDQLWVAWEAAARE
jgi:hypothetical protein